jgi:hypothetical protein
MTDPATLRSMPGRRPWPHSVGRLGFLEAGTGETGVLGQTTDV